MTPSWCQPRSRRCPAPRQRCGPTRHRCPPPLRQDSTPSTSRAVQLPALVGLARGRCGRAPGTARPARLARGADQPTASVPASSLAGTPGRGDRAHGRRRSTRRLAAPAAVTVPDLVGLPEGLRPRSPRRGGLHGVRRSTSASDTVPAGPCRLVRPAGRHTGRRGHLRGICRVTRARSHLEVGAHAIAVTVPENRDRTGPCGHRRCGSRRDARRRRPPSRRALRARERTRPARARHPHVADGRHPGPARYPRGLCDLGRATGSDAQRHRDTHGAAERHRRTGRVRHVRAGRDRVTRRCRPAAW